MKKEFKLPKTPAACADLLYKTREQRLKLQKEAEELESLEKAIKEFLIDTLPKSDAAGITGKLVRVTIVPKSMPQVKDWDEFWKFVKSKKGGMHFMQKRISTQAIEELLDSGIEVPGVEVFNYKSVSLNKV